MGYWGNVLRAVTGVEYDGNSYFYKVWDSLSKYLGHTSDYEKIELILRNPAALYIFTLLPELFSMGKWEMTTKEGDPIDEHPLLDLLHNPNPMQTGTQFLWDYQFHRKLGTANLYIDSKVPDFQNKMYFLRGDAIEWPNRITNYERELVLSESTLAQIKRATCVYRPGGKPMSFPFEKLLQFHDISNGINSYYRSPSRIDALYKIVTNSSLALNAKNINAQFAGKFLVSGTVGIEQTSKLPMRGEEKATVREAMRSKETIYPMKTKSDISRFVDNPGILEALDKTFMNDVFILGKMFNIPKNVIEMLGDDATYENQEKARAMIVSYCLQPDADDMASGILRYFGYNTTGEMLRLRFDHLPFVQTLEADRAEVLERKSNAMMRFVSSGVPPEIAAETLGFEDWKDIEFNDPIRLLGSEQNPNNDAAES